MDMLYKRAHEKLSSKPSSVKSNPIKSIDGKSTDSRSVFKQPGLQRQTMFNFAFVGVPKTSRPL